MALAEGEPRLEALQQMQDDTADSLRDTETKLADWQQRWDSHTRTAGESSRAAEVERTKLNYLDRQAVDLSRRREALEAEQKATDVAALDAAAEQLQIEHETQHERVESLGTLLDQHKTGHEKVLDEERQVQSSLNEARQQLQSARGRQSSLEALQHAALGQEESAASGWLARLGLDKSRRLGESLQVEAGWETAVETVLGRIPRQRAGRRVAHAGVRVRFAGKRRRRAGQCGRGRRQHRRHAGGACARPGGSGVHSEPCTDRRLDRTCA